MACKGFVLLRGGVGGRAETLHRLSCEVFMVSP